MGWIRRTPRLFLLVLLPLTQGCLTTLAAEADFRSVHAPVEVTGLEVRARPVGKKARKRRYRYRQRLVAQVRSACGELSWRRLHGSSQPMSVIGPFAKLPEEQAELRRLAKGTSGRVFTFVQGELGVHELVRTSNRTLRWREPELDHPLEEGPHNTTASAIGHTLLIIGGVVGDVVCVLSVVAAPIILVAAMAPAAAGALEGSESLESSGPGQAEARARERRRSRLGSWKVENRTRKTLRLSYTAEGVPVRRTLTPGAEFELHLRPGRYPYTLARAGAETQGETELRAGATTILDCASAGEGAP